jgi:hypothetical protein
MWPTIFYYAIAGAGKTNALRTLKHLDPLVLATEDGNTKGMSTLGDLRLGAVPIDFLNQLVAVTAELKARAKPGELYYQAHGPFRCLAVDSLTGVGPMLEAAAIAMKGWDMIWDAKSGGHKDPRTAYPYIAERGRKVVRDLMSLPVPLILTCREQSITEGQVPNQKEYPGPELPGAKLPKELPGWPEATMRLRMINGVRQFVTENEGDIVARVRLKEGARVPKYCKPDLGLILRVLQGEYHLIPQLTVTAPEVAKTPQQIAAAARTTTPAVQPAKP